MGGLPADCILEDRGVPASVARVFWPPAQSRARQLLPPVIRRPPQPAIQEGQHDPPNRQFREFLRQPAGQELAELPRRRLASSRLRQRPALHLARRTRPLDVRNGMVRTDCDRPFRSWYRCATQLPGIAGDVTVTEVACLPRGYSPVQSKITIEDALSLIQPTSSAHDCLLA